MLNLIINETWQVFIEYVTGSLTFSQLEPQINGPFTPDLGNPISKIGEEAVKNGWPLEIKVGTWCIVHWWCTCPNFWGTANIVSFTYPSHSSK